jgi:tetratricopeptide (TPR) repeat protein
MALGVIAMFLAGIAITLYIHKARRSGAKSVVVVQDAALVVPEPDAEQIAIAPPDARVHAVAIDAGIASAPMPDAAVRVATMPDAGVRVAAVDAGLRVAAVDAGVRVAAVDAGVRVAAVDAGVRVASADGGVDDKAKEARALLEQAHAALEDGDPDKALQLADASLKLRKTARTFLERARALQRLGQVDEALKSVDSAMEIVADYAPAWEQRGMILWSARRHDEARPALEKYLELDPNGRDAPSVRQMLGQP